VKSGLEHVGLDASRCYPQPKAGRRIPVDLLVLAGSQVADLTVSAVNALLVMPPPEFDAM